MQKYTNYGAKIYELLPGHHNWLLSNTVIFLIVSNSMKFIWINDGPIFQNASFSQVFP